MLVVFEMFGRRLEEIRKDRNISTRALATIVAASPGVHSCSHTAIQNWEKGTFEHPLPRATVTALEAALDVEPGTFFELLGLRPPGESRDDRLDTLEQQVAELRVGLAALKDAVLARPDAAPGPSARPAPKRAR